MSPADPAVWGIALCRGGSIRGAQIRHAAHSRIMGSVGSQVSAMSQCFVLERCIDLTHVHLCRVYEGYPYLLAEMYAYSMAAAHEKLPHLQVLNHMVSNVGDYGEGWPWVDALSDVCEPPDANGRFFSGKPMVTFVHFCQNYRAGNIGFGKRAVPHDIFSCASPMLVEPPRDLDKADFRIHKNKVCLHQHFVLVAH